MSDGFFALIMKVQCVYYYSSPRKMWILEKSILEVLGQKYLKFAIVCLLVTEVTKQKCRWALNVEAMSIPYSVSVTGLVRVPGIP